MKAIMLAAGLGARLGGSGSRNLPKVLLRFGGKSLLQRHIEILKQNGIEELVLGVGFNREEIEREIAVLGANDFARTLFNPDYEAGSVVTLWTLRHELCWGGPALLMDGDVLYDSWLMERLVTSVHSNCVLLDRVSAQDEEAVKLCIRDREVVEFRKWLSADFDFCGESVGFFRLSARVAATIVRQVGLYIEQGRRNDPYEEPLRDVMLTSKRGTFSYEDVTGLPWIEIDWAVDVDRANSEVLPRIQTVENLGEATTVTGRAADRASEYE